MGNWNNGEWCYYRSYFTKEECEKIIRDASQLPKEAAKVGGGTICGTNPKVRKSRVSFLQANDPRFTYIFDALWKTATEANNEFFNIHISKLDAIQFAEYDASYEGEYREHHDVFWINHDPFHHRKLSCVVQLSDPNEYEGGFLELTETTNPLFKECQDQGSIVFFPSMLRHRAHKVTKGVRYSLAAWFEGPKWR